MSHYDRLTLLHSLSFRACELHLFAALLIGASLFPYDMARSGVSGLADWLRQEEITVWHSIPTVCRQMIETLAPAIAEMAAAITAQRGEIPGGENLEHLLAELESLSDDEAQRRLAAKGSNAFGKRS